MKRILPLAKKSAKEVFLKLREKWPYFCNSLNEEIFVWREFFNHISFKERKDLELVKRLLIFPFIEKIIKIWEVIKNKDSNIFSKISLKSWKDIFSIIIIEKNNKLYLLSCFIEYNKKNKNLS